MVYGKLQKHICNISILKFGFRLPTFIYVKRREIELQLTGLKVCAVVSGKKVICRDNILPQRVLSFYTTRHKGHVIVQYTLSPCIKEL
jgi:hypothetical protein